MTLLSHSTRRPSLDGPREPKHEPFTAFARVVPTRGFGRRFEMIRDLEKKAQIVEDDLNDAGFNIALPVAFTHPFQQVPARLTIVGFVEVGVGSVGESGNFAPVTPTQGVIHSGTVIGEKTELKTPPQGNQGWGDDPTSGNMTDVMELKASLEDASTGLEVFYIEYKGVKYGQHPNRKGFFSFPS